MMDLWKKRNWKPMLLDEMEKPFSSQDYIYEIKFDGIRALLFVDKNGVIVRSRNNRDLTELFPEIEDVKRQVNPKEKVIFDGEIVSLEDGKPSFSKLQNRLHTKNKYKIKRESLENPVKYIAFDVLYKDENICDKELLDRKRVLNKFRDTDVFIKSHVYESDGVKLFKEIKKQKLEGIVAKRKKGTYHINERTDDFIKIKNIKVDNFLVCGYSEKENVVTLLLGKKKNDRISYVGKVTMGKKNELYEKLKKLPNSKSPFEEVLKEDIKYVDPIYSCRCEYLEKTKAGHLRHAVYKGENESFE